MVKKLTNGFIDKDLTAEHHGSFGRLDKGRVARFEVGDGSKRVILEFFISFLDSVANAENVKVDEKVLFQKAEKIASEFAIKTSSLTEPKLFFLYNFSSEEFLAG